MATLKLKTSGSTETNGEFSTKKVADYLMQNDSGRDDDGFYQEKIEANKEFVEQNVSARFHSGTFLGFDCNLSAVYDVLDPA